MRNQMYYSEKDVVLSDLHHVLCNIATAKNSQESESRQFTDKEMKGITNIARLTFHYSLLKKFHFLSFRKIELKEELLILKIANSAKGEK